MRLYSIIWLCSLVSEVELLLDLKDFTIKFIYKAPIVQNVWLPGRLPGPILYYTILRHGFHKKNTCLTFMESMHFTSEQIFFIKTKWSRCGSFKSYPLSNVWIPLSDSATLFQSIRLLLQISQIYFLLAMIQGIFFKEFQSLILMQYND